MCLAPLGGEAGRLFAIKDTADDVWGEEGEVDHLLDAALGYAICCRDMCKGLTGLDAFEPNMRFGNVPDQGLIAGGRLIGTLLSGLTYQIGGLTLVMGTAAVMVVLAALTSGRLTDQTNEVTA